MAMMQTGQPQGSTRLKNAAWGLFVIGILLAGGLFLAWPYLAILPAGGTATRPDLTALMLAQSGVAPDRADRPNAAAERMNRIVQLVFDAHSAGLGTKVERQFNPKWGVAFAGDTAPQAVERESRVLASAAQLGLFTALDELIADPAVYAPHPTTIPVHAYAESLVDDNAAIRQISRMLVTRLIAASNASDAPAALAAIRQDLALARASAHRPFAVPRLTAIAVTASILEQTNRQIADGIFPTAALDALAAELSGDTIPPLLYMLETERQYGHLAVASMFGRSWVRASDAGSNHAAVDRMFDLYVAAAQAPDRPAAMRTAEPQVAAIAAPFPTLRSMAGAFPTIIGADDKLASTVATLRARVSIERYRRDRGTLPKALADLVPAYLPETPKDQSGDLPYAVLDTAATRLGDGYSLGREQPAPGAGPKPLSPGR